MSQIEATLPVLTRSGIPTAGRLADKAKTSIALRGPTGWGKTSMALVLAAFYGIPQKVVTWAEAADPKCKGGVIIANYNGVHEETVVGPKAIHHVKDMDYRGITISPDESPTVAILGDRPFLIVLDEWQGIPGPVKQVFRPVLEAPEGADRFIGVHKVAPNVKFMVTYNGRADDTDNGKELSQPDIARVNCYDWGLTLPEFLDHTAAEFGGSLPWAYLNFFKEGAKTEGEGLNPWTGKVSGEATARYKGGQICCPRNFKKVMMMFPDIAASDWSLDEFRDHGPSRLPDAVIKDMALLMQTTLSMADVIGDIRAGVKSASDFPSHEQPPLAFAALRIALNEAAGDFSTAIHSGQWDWVFDLFKACSPELGSWIVSTLAAHTEPEDKEGRNPLWDHPAGKELKGLLK